MPAYDDLLYATRAPRKKSERKVSLHVWDEFEPASHQKEEKEIEKADRPSEAFDQSRLNLPS